MNNKYKSNIKNIFWPAVVFHKLVLNNKSYLHSTGWIESVKKSRPCLHDGREIPWMNYQTVMFLSNRLNRDHHLFEFGSGYSTLFYSKLVLDVVSVEYDKDWFLKIKEMVQDNVALIYREKDVNGKYCRTISETDQAYDVVIVDGRDRVNCVKQSIGALSDRGVIILDDSSRSKYAEAIRFAEEHGFRSLDLEGLKPTGYEIDRSTILYRDRNCLGI